uniref:Gnk2-homologous domain-containing protein n=1 Tax=Salix viminalis TaxID=40686 RepID=A0A6N2MGM5_SALVM
MSSSRLTSSLYLLAFALLLQNVLGIENSFVRCVYGPNNMNATATSSYNTSLSVLLGSMNQLAPVEGFALGSLGQNNLDRPYGLLLCRGDVSSSDCRTCALLATSEIRKSCPNSRGGFIAIPTPTSFGQIDDNTTFYMWNENNVSNPVVFNQKTVELLSQLATKASYNSTKLFAAGEMDLPEGSTKVYGMTTCTRDLSSADCKKCLDGAIVELLRLAYGKEVARFVGGSCTVDKTSLSVLMVLSITCSSEGFALGSLGQNTRPTYGSSLQRRCLTSDCRTCAVIAARRSQELPIATCNHSYSDTDFFGQIDEENKFYMWNVNNVSNQCVYREDYELLSNSDQGFL